MKFLMLIAAILISVCISGAIAQQAMEDVVYLKNGSIIRGTIIEQTPGKSLKIQTKDGNIFVYGFDDITKITKEGNATSSHMKYGKSPKNTGVAFVLSWLVPGAGQVYNNQPVKGAIQFGASVAGYIIFLNQLPWTEEVHYFDPSGAGLWRDEEKGNGTLAWTGFAVALGSHVWSMIDAPLTASRLNREAGLSFNRIDINNNLALSMTPAAAKNGHIGSKLALTYKF
jgi:hypothetical protein